MAFGSSLAGRKVEPGPTCCHTVRGPARADPCGPARTRADPRGPVRTRADPRGRRVARPARTSAPPKRTQ
eukprot:780063-Prymnesium_polylepis.1